MSCPRRLRKITEAVPSEVWPQVGSGVPAAAATSAAAEHGAAAIAASAAGASVPSAAFVRHSRFVVPVSDGPSPVVVEASAVPDPAFAEAFAAVAGISGPSWRSPCSERECDPSVEDPGDETRRRSGRRSPLEADPIPGSQSGGSQGDDKALPLLERERRRR